MFATRIETYTNRHINRNNNNAALFTSYICTYICICMYLTLYFINIKCLSKIFLHCYWSDETNPVKPFYKFEVVIDSIRFSKLLFILIDILINFHAQNTITKLQNDVVLDVLFWFPVLVQNLETEVSSITTVVVHVYIYVCEYVDTYNRIYMNMLLALRYFVYILFKPCINCCIQRTVLECMTTGTSLVVVLHLKQERTKNKKSKLFRTRTCKLNQNSSWKFFNPSSLESI